MKYIAGWNIAGYLPDMEPMIFDSKEEANEWLEAEKLVLKEETPNYEYEFFLEEYHDLKSYEVGIPMMLFYAENEEHAVEQFLYMINQEERSWLIVQEAEANGSND